MVLAVSHGCFSYIKRFSQSFCLAPFSSFFSRVSFPFLRTRKPRRHHPAKRHRGNNSKEQSRGKGSLNVFICFLLRILLWLVLPSLLIAGSDPHFSYPLFFTFSSFCPWPLIYRIFHSPIKPILTSVNRPQNLSPTVSATPSPILHFLSLSPFSRPQSLSTWKRIPNNKTPARHFPDLDSTPGPPH